MDVGTPADHRAILKWYSGVISKVSYFLSELKYICTIKDFTVWSLFIEVRSKLKLESN